MLGQLAESCFASSILIRVIQLLASGPLSALGLPYYYVLNFQSSALSNYNSLQVRLNVRDLHGFTSTVNYTYSHSIDTASDGQDYAPFQSQPDNSFNVRNDRSNSGFDVRQRFSWLWNYSIPGGHTMPWLTGGWSVSGRSFSSYGDAVQRA